MKILLIKSLPQLFQKSLIGAITISLLSVSVGTIPVSADTQTLQQDVNNLQNSTGDTGVLAEVHDHGQVYRARAGVVQVGTTTPLPFDARYRTGSITKTFIATTILQLVGEGKLSLDDTVDHWLPGVITGNGNDGTKITVRELLNHTSGLYNYTDDPSLLPMFTTFDGFNANRTHHYDPQDLIKIALSHQPNFAPGTSWSYSNTNYIVAGEIIKAVTGNTWDTEVNNRIIKPLGLKGTSAPGDTVTLPSPYEHGYIILGYPSNTVYTDVTEDNMTWGGSAGSLISTTSDESTFFQALMTGKLLAPAQTAQMQTTFPLSKKIGYGLGLAIQQVSCTKTPVIWHNGGTTGYYTWAGTTPDGSVSLVFSEPTTTFGDIAWATTTTNLENTLIRHVFCGPQATSTDTFQQVPSSPL